MRNLWIGGLAGLVLVGCGASKEPVAKPTVESLKVALPSEYESLEIPDWSARRVVAVDLPGDPDLQMLMEDPFFEPMEWEGLERETARTRLIEGIEAWETELAGPVGTAIYEDEVLSNLFQRAVALHLVKGQLLLAEGADTEAAESVRDALVMAIEGLDTGPGVTGLNQTVPVLMSADMAVAMGSQPGLNSAERDLYLLDPLRQIDFREVARRKLKEFVVLDVLDRVVNVGRTDGVALAAANLMGRGEDTDAYLTFAEGALTKDGGSFDAQQCLEIAVGWVDEMVDALGDDWPAFEDVLAAREEMLLDTWGIHPFELANLEESGIKAPAGSGKKMLPVLFAYEISQSVVPMVESAMVSQMKVDAAELSIMVADAGLAGVRVRDLGDLEMRFPRARASMVDPLTGGEYEIDFGSRRLRTGLGRVSEKRFLLEAVRESGLRF